MNINATHLPGPINSHKLRYTQATRRATNKPTDEYNPNSEYSGEYKYVFATL